MNRRSWLYGLLAILPIFALAAVLTGCGSSGSVAGGTNEASDDSSAVEPSASASENSVVTVRVGSLKGPTSIGIASLMDKAAAGGTSNSYEFTIAATADEIVPSIISGDLDIALVPANVASVLCKKTDGGVKAIDINTLGVLSVVTGDTSIASFGDLAGKTVYMTGKGTTPEYVVNYLLDQANITGTTLEFKSEASEVVATLSADPTAIGILPQPYVTAATTKNPDLIAAIDLNDVWADLAAPDSSLVTGVTIARSDFVKEHPEAVAEFLKEHASSVDIANDDPETVAKLVVNAGILDNEAVVTKAIPACHLVCITNSEMSALLSGYLEVLYGVDPSSVGGALPPENFYYLG